MIFVLKTIIFFVAILFVTPLVFIGLIDTIGTWFRLIDIKPDSLFATIKNKFCCGKCHKNNKN